jgi:hypothetical protein
MYHPQSMSNLKTAATIAAGLVGGYWLPRRVSTARAVAFAAISGGGALYELNRLSYPLPSLLWASLAVGAGLSLVVSRGLSEPRMLEINDRSLAAHPSQDGPAALLFLPAGFDANDNFDVLIYWRGWGSCVSVLAGSEPAPCRAGGRDRRPSDLMGQVQRSGRNVALLMPELLIEQNSSDPGRLAQPAALALLGDAALKATGLRNASFFNARRILVAAHSGGYVPAALTVASMGGVTDVLLLDALYGEVDTFVRFAEGGGRVTSIFTTGTTARKSEELADRTGGVFDRSTGPLSEADWRTPVLSHGSPYEHSNVPLHYVQSWLATR